MIPFYLKWTSFHKVTLQCLRPSKLHVLCPCLMIMLRNVSCFQDKVSRMGMERPTIEETGILEMKEVMFKNETWWFVTQVIAALFLQFLGTP